MADSVAHTTPFHAIREAIANAMYDTAGLREAAGRAIAAGEFSLARDAYQKLLKIETESLDVEFRLVDVKASMVRNQHVPPDLVIDLNRLVAKDGFPRDLWLEVSETYQKLGLLDDAIRAARRAGDCGVDPVMVGRRLAYLSYFQRDLRSVIRTLRRMAKRDDVPAGQLLEFADLAHKAKDTALGLRIVRKLYLVAPADLIVIVTMALFLMRTGRRQESLGLIEPHLGPIGDSGRPGLVLNASEVLSGLGAFVVEHEMLARAAAKLPGNAAIEGALAAAGYAADLASPAHRCHGERRGWWARAFGSK